MLAYWIRGAIIPKACCKAINKICYKFLFARDISKKKLQMVAWKDTCLPKKYGGLGLPSIDSLFQGFGCSLIWHFLHEDNFLFTWWKDHYHSLWFPQPKNVSSYWTFLCTVATRIKQCLTLRIHPSCSFSLLWDPWYNGKSIMEIMSSSSGEPIPRIFSDRQVKSIIVNGCWLIPTIFGIDVMTAIKSVPISVSNIGCLWLGSDCPTTPAFKMQFLSNLNAVNWYKYVWHKRYALRYSAYSWLAFKSGFKIADLLARCSIPVDTTCKFCSKEAETHTHLFFECDFCFVILKSLIPGIGSLLLKPNLFQAYCFIDELNLSRDMHYVFYLLIGATIYFIWRARNDRIGNSLTI
ncbi:hypothetical protein M5K25_008484 [Dendrobium thyrsiflorum]|uniref:Reverse transcriptase zinc-binding domain-containing protein n=1 Tax=Dendrobium thyrsiflorum TaxID=117978 RepID=A0ABD0VFN8_DENTH